MNYRREIDGLRTLAVIPVILFHAGFQTFSGGFVGVDVFFVISGYLITSIILAEKQAGTFSFVSFYERRARRILPALFVVMLACLPMAWLWMVPSQMKDFSQGLVAVTTFVPNIFFWRSSGYFASVNELKPLIHTWSLGVEEQFYLLFPIFLLLTWRLGKQRIVSILVVVGVISLAVAYWGSINEPIANFYLLPTRGWELLIGVSIAFYSFPENGNETKADKTHVLVNQSVSILGFLLIGYAIFAFDKNTPFPSFYTLIPTIGAAFIIIFANSQTVVGQLLGSRFFVGVGLISYSTYLWHQPLFAFARLHRLETASSFLFLFLSIVSIVLAYISWRFVEIPMRNKHRISRRAFFRIALFFSALLVGTGLLGNFSDGFEKRFSLPNKIAISFDRSARQDECFDRIGVNARNDWACNLGSKQEDATFMVFGDSHSLSLLDAFDTAGKKVNISGLYAGTSGCAPFLGIYALHAGKHAGDCNSLNKRVFEYVKGSRIRKVFLVSRWTYYTDGGYDGLEWSYIGLSKNSIRSKELSREAFERGLKNTVEAYSNIGVQLYIVAQVPQQIFDPKNVYYKIYTEDSKKLNKGIRKLSVPVHQHQQLQFYVGSLFEKYQQSSRIKLVVLDKIFCDDRVCLLGNEDKSYYYDIDHLSSAGSLLVVDEVKKYLIE